MEFVKQHYKDHHPEVETLEQETLVVVLLLGCCDLNVVTFENSSERLSDAFDIGRAAWFFFCSLD